MIRERTDGALHGTGAEKDRPRTGRYWLGLYCAGAGLVDGLPGEEKRLYRTPEAAVKRWLASTSKLEAESGHDLAEGLLGEVAIVVDVRSQRAVRFVSVRPALPGESRLPVTVVFNSETGRVDDEWPIERWEAVKCRQRRGLACV